jgi:nicotinamide-nucleotide amidase
MPGIAREIGHLLRDNHLTLGTVESATGGLISFMITAIPGSSDYYQGSIIAYSNTLKEKLVGVVAATLKQEGAVSAAVAVAMAEGGRRALGVDCCLSDTGIAGPGGGSVAKPAGLFYIGLSHSAGTLCREFLFPGARAEKRRAAAAAALLMLKEYLLGLG